MTDWLLVAILIMLVLNGDWPVRVTRYVGTRWRRIRHEMKRKRKNRRAARSKGAQ